MKRVVIMAGLTLTTAVALVLMSGLSASGANHGQACTELSSGKIDVDGDHKTVTVAAPEGFTITGYCVKAGSVQQGNGPHYVTLDTPSVTITFGHPSGKDVSHYAVTWVAVTPEPEPTPTPEPTKEPTPEPTLAGTGFDGVEWWHVIVGGVLLAVGMGAVVVADRRRDGE